MELMLGMHLNSMGCPLIAACGFRACRWQGALQQASTGSTAAGKHREHCSRQAQGALQQASTGRLAAGMPASSQVPAAHLLDITRLGVHKLQADLAYVRLAHVELHGAALEREVHHLQRRAAGQQHEAAMAFGT